MACSETEILSSQGTAISTTSKRPRPPSMFFNEPDGKQMLTELHANRSNSKTDPIPTVDHLHNIDNSITKMYELGSQMKFPTKVI